MKTILLITTATIFLGTILIGCDQASQHLMQPILTPANSELKDMTTDQEVPEPEPTGNTGDCIDNLPPITDTTSEDLLKELEKCEAERDEENESDE